VILSQKAGILDHGPPRRFCPWHSLSTTVSKTNPPAPTGSDTERLL